MRIFLNIALLCLLIQLVSAANVSVIETEPVYGATDIAQDPTVKIYFSQAVKFVTKVGNANPLFYVQVGAQAPISFTNEEAVTLLSRTSISIDLYKVLKTSIPSNTRVRVYFGTGLNTPIVGEDNSILVDTPFMDTNNVPRTYLSFYTGEDDIPELLFSSSQPMVNQKNFDISSDIVLTYSTFITIGHGSISIVPINKPDYIIIYDVNDVEKVSLSEDHLSLILKNEQLIGSQQYYIYINAGVVKSQMGTSSLLVAPSLYSFTTNADTVKPFITSISPVSGTLSLPTNPKFTITFSENVLPNTGLISFIGSKNTYNVNILSDEVLCTKNVCVIKPRITFSSGSYFMTFNVNTFVDTSNNLLAHNCNDYVFNVDGSSCDLDFLKNGLGDSCNCISTATQCQCNCGETVFIKKY